MKRKSLVRSAAGKIEVECCCLELKGGVVAHCAQTMLVAYAGGTASAYDAPAERTSDFLRFLHESRIDEFYGRNAY